MKYTEEHDENVISDGIRKKSVNISSEEMECTKRGQVILSKLVKIVDKSDGSDTVSTSPS